jgi:8-amino-7-oxononanoate synthase
MTTTATDALTTSKNWIHEKAANELKRIYEAREKQVYPYFREFEQGGIHTSVAGQPIINFSSNDYLGLTNHPKVKAAAAKAVEKYACGLSSSRVQATTVEHVELERRLAKYFRFDRCLTFTTGYQAMVGTIMALADKDTTLILDAYAHACILDGTFLAAGTPGKAPEVRFFNHNSPKSLERILKTRERKNAMVLVEGIYSLDGDLGLIREFVEICNRHGAVLVVDDAHGSGTLGKTGTGILELLGLTQDDVPIVISTFSKTFGGIGGILLAKDDIVDLVRHNARSFLFSASLPLPIVAAASTILDMLETEGEQLVTELNQKANYFRDRLTKTGFDLGASNTHIMPVMCRDERKALFMHTALFECGVLMVPITYPGVKQGEERLRVNVTRGHTQEDLDTAHDLLQTYGEAFFVLSGEELGPYED